MKRMEFANASCAKTYITENNIMNCVFYTDQNTGRTILEIQLV